jgi:tetratricopeptide (TPR) repeat protein
MSAIYVWFYKNMAFWATVFKKHEMAAEYWLRIADLRPKDPLALTAAAHCMTEANRPLESETLLRRCTVIEPTYAAAWFNLGFLVQKREDHSQALELFDQAIRHNDKLDRAHYGRALSLIALDRPEEAKAALKRTIDLQPMSPYGYYQLATLHHRLGDDSSCVKLVKKLSLFEPQLAAQLQRETGVKAGVEDPFAKYKR